MTEVSDNVKAFRGAMEGLVAEHASSVRAVEQRWSDTAAAADKSASEQVDKAQKLVARVRERSEDLRKQEEKDDRGEIDYVDEEEPDEVDPEVERFSEQINEARRERAESASRPAGREPAPSPTTTSAAPDPSAWPRARPGRFGRAEADQHAAGAASSPEKAEPAPGQGWSAKAGRFGRGDQQRPSGRSDRTDQRESDVDEPGAESDDREGPDRRWQVRAGRFGRSDQRSSPEQRARPARPPANRRPADQDHADEDDFSGGSWLR